MTTRTKRHAMTILTQIHDADEQEDCLRDECEKRSARQYPSSGVASTGIGVPIGALFSKSQVLRDAPGLKN